jgi:hypothetical protein
MCVTPTGNVLVTGVYQGTAIFDVTTLRSAGEQDIFLAEPNASDHDNCEGSRCRGQDDDNRRRPESRFEGRMTSNFRTFETIWFLASLDK